MTKYKFKSVFRCREDLLNVCMCLNSKSYLSQISILHTFIPSLYASKMNNQKANR